MGSQYYSQFLERFIYTTKNFILLFINMYVVIILNDDFVRLRLSELSYFFERSHYFNTNPFPIL